MPKMFSSTEVFDKDLYTQRCLSLLRTFVTTLSFSFSIRYKLKSCNTLIFSKKNKIMKNGKRKSKRIRSDQFAGH